MGQRGWFVRDIEWRKLWRRQDYANFLLTAFIVVAIICVTVLATPHVVPYYLWDARISYPLLPNTIPSWVAVFAPLMMLLLTVGMGEFVASRRTHASVTDATSTFVYFFLDGVQSFIMGLLLTQVFKVMVGRLRPNFLATCLPEVPPGQVLTTAAVDAAIGGAAEQYACTGDDVNAARVAFPSGHTSVCFNLAVYASGYLIWVWHWRHPTPPRRNTFWEEFKVDLVNVLSKAWMLGMLCFAWGVGISRIVDYAHDPSDVVGGALLGTMIALVYLLRAIPRWRRVLAAEGSSDALHSADAEAPLGASAAYKQPAAEVEVA